jgi:2-methylcitrate dehydratase PrpD
VVTIEQADPTGQLVDYIAAVRYEHLPAAVVDAVKKSFLDTIGAGIAGRSTEIGRIVTDMALENGGKPEAALWTEGVRVPAVEAAFANAVMARCRELDDVHEGSPRVGMGHGGHVNVMLVPAALATIESLPVPTSGKDLIVALAVGGDLIPRLRMAAGNAGRLGWEGPTLGPFGVAATVARLRRFDRATTASALGTAYAHCAGTILSTSDGTWDVWLNAGIAARSGMVSAELARRGHKGARAPLLGSSGLYPLYFRGEYHADALLSDLGKEFESGNVSIKPYSSCKATHHAIYTLQTLMARHGIDQAAIDRIDVRTSDYNMRLAVLNEHGEPKHSPRSLNEAQFSIPFTMAAVAVRGSVFPDVFNEAILGDERVKALAKKIQVSPSAEKNELASREGYASADVEIYLANGKTIVACEPNVKGHPANPLSFDEVAEKFTKCVALAEKAMPDRAVGKLVDAVTRLEDCQDMREIARLL